MAAAATTTPPPSRAAVEAPSAPVRPVQLAAKAAVEHERAAKRNRPPADELDDHGDAAPATEDARGGAPPEEPL